MNKILFWTCDDECKYDCMWRTTNSFLDREWAVPQFYGKVCISYQLINFKDNFLLMFFFQVAISKISWISRAGFGRFFNF